MKSSFRLFIIVLSTFSTGFNGCTYFKLPASAAGGSFTLFPWNDQIMNCLNPANERPGIQEPGKSLFLQIVRRGNPQEIFVLGITGKARLINSNSLDIRTSHPGFKDNSVEWFAVVALLNDTEIKGNCLPAMSINYLADEQNAILIRTRSTLCESAGIKSFKSPGDIHAIFLSGEITDNYKLQQVEGFTSEGHANVDIVRTANSSDNARWSDIYSRKN